PHSFPTRRSSDLRQIYLCLAEENRKQFDNPFHVNGTESFLNWATRAQPERNRLSLFLEKIYRSRYDVAAAFPDIGGRDREQFLTWARTQGAHEMGYDPELAIPKEAPEPQAAGSGSNGERPRFSAGYQINAPSLWSAGATQVYTVMVVNAGR